MEPALKPGWRLPAFLDARRLEGRIVRFFLVLLLLVQLTSYALVERTLRKRLEADVEKSLQEAQSLLREELHQRLPREQSKAAVLVQDMGFVDAVGALHLDEAGPPTLHDAVDNLRRRAGARLAAYVELDGEVQSAQPQAAEAARLTRQMLMEIADEEAGGDPSTFNLAVVRGEPLQMVRVPVRVPVSSPQPSGELLLGFSIRPGQLVRVKRYANADAAIGLQRGNQWPSAVEVEARDTLPVLLAQAAIIPEDKIEALVWQGEELRVRRYALPAVGTAADEQLSALLWVEVQDQLKPINALRSSLILLNLAGLALFALGSVFTARRLTGPIEALRDFARRLGGGDYDTPVRTGSSLSEVQALAESFESMRQGIREKQADIERYAYWDRLTGLPNRAQFVERLGATLAERPARQAVLLLNLDRFKPVNDLLGRERGDRLLVQVAERLKSLLPEGRGLLARFGGDEFAFTLAGGAAEALALAAQVHAALATPVDLERRATRRGGEATAEWMKVDVGASIGIALYPQHHTHPDDLIRQAERAMDLAKRRRDGSLLFEEGMDPRSEYSLSLRSELVRAIEQNELRLFLQPKRSLQLESEPGQLDIYAAEALVRWQHPERGMVPPGQFIPFAEETGFVRQLTQWVLRAAARHAADARLRGLRLQVAVNLSTRDLLEADLLGKLRQMLAEEGCEPAWLCLEITESAIMDDPARALETVKALKREGFRLAIDDFGTGYSSLAYLQKLPIDEVKIDQSFVFGLEHNEKNQTIVRSTIQLVHELKGDEEGLGEPRKHVVAEGVETAEALELLRQWGCDEAQGYFIARPMPAEKLIQKLLDGALDTRH